MKNALANAITNRHDHSRMQEHNQICGRLRKRKSPESNGSPDSTSGRNGV